MRADIIGVSVKLTSSDTRTANAMVNPKLFMKRPTMPPMNATGMNTATSDSVVASTARPISRVASTAAWKGGNSFSSMNRQMFSSTTIASSMTMPTASVRASMVIELSVRPMYQIRPKVAMIDAGIATEAMMVDRQFPRNSQDHQRREERADHEVLLDALDRGLDELRLVAHDADVVARRQLRLHVLEPLLDVLHDLHRVGAGLPTDEQHDRADAVDPRQRRRVGHAVLDARDVAQQDRVALALLHDDLVELRRWRPHAPASAARASPGPVRRARRGSRRSAPPSRARRRVTVTL